VTLQKLSSLVCWPHVSRVTVGGCSTMCGCIASTVEAALGGEARMARGGSLRGCRFGKRSLVSEGLRHLTHLSEQQTRSVSQLV